MVSVDPRQLEAVKSLSDFLGFLKDPSTFAKLAAQLEQAIGEYQKLLEQYGAFESAKTYADYRQAVLEEGLEALDVSVAKWEAEKKEELVAVEAKRKETNDRLVSAKQAEEAARTLKAEALAAVNSADLRVELLDKRQAEIRAWEDRLAIRQKELDDKLVALRALAN